jgi:membrane protein required for colicin V production
MMNTADGAILVFWLVCLVRGVFRGPVNELFAIAGVLSGLFAAAFFYPDFSYVLSGWMDSEPMRCLIGFFTLFGGIYLLATVSGVIAVYLFHLRRPGWVNRALGAGFGILKGMLAVAVLLIPLVAFLPNQSAWMGRSVLVPYENRISEKMVRILPQTIHTRFTSHMPTYKQSWHRNGK